MDATLYGIPGSHSVKTAELMLDHKGINHRRVDLEIGSHWDAVRSHGFAEPTVPALLIAGGRLQGSRSISRGLDGLRPDPGLFPADPTTRTAVEEAERFGEETLQPLARRLVLAGGARDLSSLLGAGAGGALGQLLAPDASKRASIMRLAAPYFEVTDEREQRDMAHVSPILERVEGWIELGVVGGPERNAADFQIAPSVCLLMYRIDLLDAIRGRPSGAFAEGIVSAAHRLPSR
jgi:glutathione S-transferase